MRFRKNEASTGIGNFHNPQHGAIVLVYGIHTVAEFKIDTCDLSYQTDFNQPPHESQHTSQETHTQNLGKTSVWDCAGLR
jgi:hypothetical protein